MSKQDWRSQTFALSWLRERRFDFDPASASPVFDWLRAIGVVPAEVAELKWGHNQNAPLLNPDAIKAGYISQVAAEWDSWGRSTPTQFLDAMELETVGTTKRDVIAETLEALGRAIAEESQEDTAHRLRLPRERYAA